MREQTFIRLKKSTLQKSQIFFSKKGTCNHFQSTVSKKKFQPLKIQSNRRNTRNKNTK